MHKSYLANKGQKTMFLLVSQSYVYFGFEPAFSMHNWVGK